MFDKPTDHPIDWMIIGAMIAGLGKLLASDAEITWRLAIGRAITSGVLGVAAGMGYLFWPGMDPIVAIGLACGVASLGTDGILAMLNRKS